MTDPSPFDRPSPSGSHPVVEVRVTSQSSDKLPSLHDLNTAEKRVEFSVAKAAAEVLRGVFSRNALLLLLVLGGAVASTLWGVNAFGQSVSSRIDAGQRAQDIRLDAEAAHVREFEARFVQHVEDSGKAHADLKADMREVQIDLREFYRASRNNSRSLRLERAPTITLDAGD